MEVNEQDLIQQILEGNAQAFRQLVEQYKDLVFRTCMGLLHDVHEADDITQEVFIEVFQSIASFRFQSKFSTWLYRIAVNKSLNHLKKMKRKKMFSRIEDLVHWRGAYADSGEPMADAADLSLEEKEQSRLLQEALDALPENQRTAFVLFRYDELSQKEIAEIMHLSVPAVESLIHRAKQTLQKKLLHIFKNRQES